MTKISFRCIGVFSLVFALVLLQGCILAPVIDGFSDLGTTNGDRQALLGKRVKQFNEALYWGIPTRALALATVENRGKLMDQLRSNSESEKIVETKVAFMDFNEDATSADVDVKVKFYRIPYYMVTERTERQKWEFFARSGWLLSARDLVAKQISDRQISDHGSTQLPSAG